MKLLLIASTGLLVIAGIFCTVCIIEILKSEKTIWQLKQELAKEKTRNMKKGNR